MGEIRNRPATVLPTARNVVGIEDPARVQASVLIVDDQPGRLLAYEAMLSGLGVDCVKAASGDRALERVLKQPFAVILLDVRMPGMDGFEVARLIRSHPRYGRTPIMFVTAGDITELEHLKAYELGAIDYITMPIAPEVLRSKVAVLVELFQRRSELEVLNGSLEAARSRLAAHHQEAVAQRDAQLEAVFEHPFDMTVVLQAEVSDDGEVIDWVYRRANHAARELLGFTKEGLVGRRLGDVLPDRRARVIEQCTRVLKSGTPERYEVPAPNGGWYLVTVYPLGDDMVVGSGVDISDRKNAEAALRDSVTELNRLKGALEETDRRKDEFLAMLAHELRNPMAPISNASAALAALPTDDKRRPRLVSMIQRQALNMSRLLDDLLDVARVTQGRIELQCEPVTLAECVDQAVEATEPLMRSKDHRLLVSGDGAALLVHADKVRLVQCLTNLLTNAAKFTDAGGSIEVRCQTEGRMAVVEVSDNGIGIAPEFQAHLFDLFAQGKRSLDRAQGGLGIGLALCRQRIEDARWHGELPQRGPAPGGNLRPATAAGARGQRGATCAAGRASRQAHPGGGRQPRCSRLALCAVAERRPRHAHCLSRRPRAAVARGVCARRGGAGPRHAWPRRLRGRPDDQGFASVDSADCGHRLRPAEGPAAQRVDRLRVASGQAGSIRRAAFGDGRIRRPRQAVAVDGARRLPARPSTW